VGFTPVTWERVKFEELMAIAMEEQVVAHEVEDQS
jgi:hypothetical protein